MWLHFLEFSGSIFSVSFTNILTGNHDFRSFKDNRFLGLSSHLELSKCELEIDGRSFAMKNYGLKMK